ncbi:unnamed protein product [Miscanthus lutarioriparius]|uniref:MATH domain-containing protein n=1 Tax=Miscanthus lutarioriparius TaxID=422564 RepID=A0A811MYF8_9POAL|nr:unnamed protein product [Miscanthus lutarioriparius]
MASRSAIIGGSGTAAGHHLLDIEGYSHTKETPTGTFIRSNPFRAVDHSWSILYYPNGQDSDSSEYISVFLRLDDEHVTVPVKARATFSLLDRAGKPVLSHTRNTGVHHFSGNNACGYPRFIRRAYLEKSEHLEHDRFTVRCDVLVAKEFRTERKLPASSSPPLVRSPAEVFGRMKEGTDGAVIRVDDIDTQVFKTLLDFVYADMLPDCSKNVTKDKEGAAMAQHLLIAADRYNLERLKLICEDKLCDHIDTDSAATILTLAEQHQCHGLKEACFRFLSTPSTLNAVMEKDDFDHLTRSCPSVLKQLKSNIAARLPGEFGEAR